MKDGALSMVLREIRKTAADGVGDAELLGRFAANGDEAAFELLVRRHQRLVFGVCRRTLRNIHDAEDAFQATFLALARRAGRIHKREALAAWLFRVAYHTALTARAGRARRESQEQAAAAAKGTTAPDDPAAAPERREEWAAVDEEVSRLPERFRAAAVLCYLEGKTVDEAARLLGCPRGTVASRLARARARLHSRLSRRGVGLMVGVPATADGLIRPTVRAAVLYGSGKAAGQGVSLTAVALAKKVVWAMFVKKLTSSAMVLTALAGVLLLGGGLTVWFRVNAAAAPAVQKAGKEEGAPDKGTAATAVTVSRPVRREVAPYEDFTGRLVLGEEPPVAARVAGRLQVVPSKPGAEVKKGDLLFEIDPAPFKESLAKAEAGLAAAAGSDRASAEAVVERARQNLQATRILAPVDGWFRVDQNHPINGRLVGAGDQVSGTWEHPATLGWMASSDVIGVRFDMDEQTFLRYQRLLVARAVKGIGDALSIGLSDEKVFPHEGLLVSFDDHFNPATGTISVLGVFADPDSLLLPGMSARVRVPFGKPAPALETADEAIFSDQGKPYVWVVNDRNVVERREVRLGSEDDGMRVVKEGLGPDDSVVVAGGKDLHAGDKVEPYRTVMPGSKTGPRP
jgi:RND family efflux transporter MFP subunit